MLCDRMLSLLSEACTVYARTQVSLQTRCSPGSFSLVAVRSAEQLRVLSRR